MLLFQSPSWKSKAERSKASFDVCQAECRKSKLDRMPKDLEREKRNPEVCEIEC
jgi:hypothetical protein